MVSRKTASGSITTMSTGELWHDVCVMRLFQKMYLAIGGFVGFRDFVERSCGQGILKDVQVKVDGTWLV